MVPRGIRLQRDVVVSLQELSIVDLYQVTHMSYVICPKIGYIYIYIRYNIYIYTPPNELFAGEDDDMNQLIYPCWVYCKVTSTLTNKKTHGTLMVTPSACHIRRLYRHVQRPCGDASVVKIGTWGDGFHTIRWPSRRSRWSRFKRFLC